MGKKHLNVFPSCSDSAAYYEQAGKNLVTAHPVLYTPFVDATQFNSK